MKTILITGGAGFIGSHFVEFVTKTYPDCRIMVLDSLTYAGSVENLPFDPANRNQDRFEFWYGDVRNAALVSTLVSRSDFVVHFAAETHVTRSIFDNAIFFDTDVLGTQVITNAVLQARNRVARFIHVSTSEVYGTASADTMSENHILNPASPYAAAKAGGDRLVFSYWNTYRIPAVILRPFNNYGNRQHLEKVIPRFVTNAILGKKIRVHGDGLASRDYMHVSDLCRAIDLVLSARADTVEGEVFNVGSGTTRSVLSIARDVCGIFNLDPDDAIEFTGNRPGQVERHTADYSKIHEVLGWGPEISWMSGLEKVAGWYRDNMKIWEKQLWMSEVPITNARGEREWH